MQNNNKKDKRFYIINTKRIFNLIMLILAFILVFFTYFSKSNAMNIALISLACILSIAILVAIIRRSKIHIFSLITYAVLLGGSIIYNIIFGATALLQRIGYNLMMSSLAILAIVFLFCLTKIRIKKNAIVSVIISFVLVFSSFFYLLTMNIRSKPNVVSLQSGHDEYLSQIGDMTYGDNAPNVLIINMDDMGYSDISLFSYLGQENATFDTPNIDSLAEDGVFMDNFYSCSPVCSPSRFGLLTGRYQSRGYLDRVLLPSDKSLNPYNYQRFTNSFFFRNNVDGILSDEITFAEVAKAYGYNTGLIGKWHLGDYGQYLPTNQGFDYYFGSYYSNDMVPYELVREKEGKAKTVFTHNQMKDQSKTNEIYTSEVISFLENSIENNEKFFALYNSPWPHAPHYSGKTNDKTDDTYIDCIVEFDDYLGDILSFLKNKGVYDDTLIVFTSDNGSSSQGSTGELKGKKDTTFEGGHKVPMIARYPNGGLGGGSHFDGITGPKRIEARAMNIDLFPTILSYMGITQLPEDRIIDGVSLYDLLQGNIPSNSSVHNALYYIKNSEVQAIQKPVSINDSIVNMKYFESVSSEFVSIFMFKKRKNILFNLDTDPAEAYDISNKYPNVANEMKEELRAFIKQLKENRRGKL